MSEKGEGRRSRRIEQEILPPRRHHRRMKALNGREFRGWKYTSCVVFLLAWGFSIWETICWPQAGWQRFIHVTLTTTLVMTHFTGPFWFGPRMPYWARVVTTLGGIAVVVGAMMFIAWQQSLAATAAG